MPTLPDDDRHAYWAGDDTVQSRYELCILLGVPTGTIAGIVINLPPASRHSWIATMELSVDELETDTERKIAKQGRADQVRDQEQLRGEIEAMSEPRVQNDKFGYPVD